MLGASQINRCPQSGAGKRRSTKRSGKKRKASSKFLAAGNAWRAHVKETMRKNPNMKFGKPLLKLASRTYKKGSSGPSSPSSSSGVTVKTSKYDIKVRPRKTCLLYTSPSPRD